MDLLKDDPQALCLVRATSGHYVIIAASCCVAYAENKRHDNRVNSVRAFLAALDLLQASGNIDARNGQALTGKRLQAHGLDEITPLEPCFGCTGVPRGPTIDAQLCKQCPGSADANVYHCRVGEKQPHHVLHNDNLFICLPCRRNVERWELNVLEHKERNGPLTEHEENRLVVLRARADNNRVRSNELRKTNVVAKGLEAVQERERAKDRSHRSRQTEDPA